MSRLEPVASASGRESGRVFTPGKAELILVFGGAFVLFLLLSRYFLVSPGTVVTLRNNVLFETDSGVRLRYLSEHGIRPASRLEFFEHPAFFLLFRPMGLALTHAFDVFVSRAQAAVLAVQLLICSSAAAGNVAIYAFASRFGLGRGAASLSVLLLTFATSTIMVVVPEHWAMAQGLMLVAFYIATLPGRPRAGRLALVGVLCALIAATTITNAVFGLLLAVPVALAMGVRPPARRTLITLGVVAIALAVTAGWLITRMQNVAGFLNLRLIDTPPAALTYGVFGLVAPLVGPSPHQLVERQHLVLSYEPVSFSMYPGMALAGAVAWGLLLVICAAAALRNRATRPLALLVCAWIGFNLVFHNLWGDEFFLYSPHWTWALVILTMLGMQHVRSRWALPLAALVLVGQIAALLNIGNVLRHPAVDVTGADTTISLRDVSNWPAIRADLLVEGTPSSRA